MDRYNSDRDARLDVCLIVPPFDTLRFPPLGPSILASACQARGLRIKTVYGSILLGSRIGYDAYMAVCTESVDLMVGERLFRPHAYPAEVQATLPDCGPLPRKMQRIHDSLVPAIGPFLETLVNRVLDLKPRLVGISSTFQQNLAAAALARLIKARAPEICVALGGANVTSPMGRGLSHAFPWIDHFFAGEADVEFPAFCARFIETGARPDAKVIECEPIRDMSIVSSPDFSDYFASLRDAQSRGELPPELPRFLSMESSRGCWWGAKHHCTFCGLNGETMDFRSKTARRVFDEIHDIARLWKANRIFFADNIMPVSYLRDLLPALARWKDHPTLFYEVKANLRDEQLDLMANAGIRGIQPGIESFSSNLLRLMRKGVSGLQNLTLLRSCRSIGIDVTWNYLYGFPGERIEDYEWLPPLFAKIEHLQPPLNCEQVIIDRFSPYQAEPEHFGFASISPFKAYAGLYPPGTPLAEIAYHFTAEYSTPVLDCEGLLAQLHAAVRLWKQQWAPGSLRPVLKLLDTGAEEIVIADTRRVAKRKTTVVSRESDVALKYFERPRPRDRLDGALADHADDLLQRDFLVEHEGHLLSVVTRPRGIVPLSEPGSDCDATENVPFCLALDSRQDLQMFE
jgi:ribosomal peptide maturation radical SAM protein 1